MTEKNLLSAFTYIDKEFIEEAGKDPYPVQNRLKRPLLLAAIVALMLCLMGSAIVAMRLQNLTIDTPTITDYWGGEHRLISLQGYEGSKNYAAVQEWHQFLESYDSDKSILYANNDFKRPDAYAPYYCYSWDMVEKLKEICLKYGLEPLGKAWDFRQVEHLFEAVGIDSVFTDKAITDGHTITGYCFRDGTFDLEGDLRLLGPWEQDVGFGMRSVQKTSFDDVIGSIGGQESYDQWEYTMGDGTRVLLALQASGGERCREGAIIADKSDCFVVVSAHGPLADLFGGIPNDRAFMEDFCEAFDFTYNACQVDPELAYALQCEEEPHTYAEWIDYLLTDEEQAQFFPDLTYALLDINDDGQEELLLRCGNHDFTQQQRDQNSFCTITGMQDGELVHLVGHGVCYLCGDNIIEYLSPFESEPASHTYERFGKGYKPQLIDDIVLREEDGKLYHQVNGELVEITQAEADAIVAKYPHIEIEFKPATEFRDRG